MRSRWGSFLRPSCCQYILLLAKVGASLGCRQCSHMHARAHWADVLRGRALPYGDALRNKEDTCERDVPPQVTNGETGFLAYETRFWFPSEQSLSHSPFYYSYEVPLLLPEALSCTSISCSLCTPKLHTLTTMQVLLPCPA